MKGRLAGVLLAGVELVAVALTALWLLGFPVLGSPGFLLGYGVALVAMLSSGAYLGPRSVIWMGQTRWWMVVGWGVAFMILTSGVLAVSVVRFGFYALYFPSEIWLDYLVRPVAWTFAYGSIPTVLFGSVYAVLLRRGELDAGSSARV